MPKFWKGYFSALLLTAIFGIGFGMLGSCVMLPAPLSQLSNILSAYDVTMYVKERPTIADTVVSKYMGRECRIMELNCEPKTATQLIAEYVEDMK
jgi:hypothetical protein